MRAPIKATVLLAVLVMASFSLTSAQDPVWPSVWVDMADVEGLTPEGRIPSGGGDLTIPVRMFNMITDLPADTMGGYRTAISNGFYFRSDDGVTIGSIALVKNCDYKWDMECAFMQGCYPWTGCYAWFDMYWGATVLTDGLGGLGIAGLSNQGTGLPPDFNDIAYSFVLTGVSGPDNAELVMDTTYWEPGNFWLWTAVGDSVLWGGGDNGYVFKFEGGCDPVAITSTQPAGPFTDGDAYSYDVDAAGVPPILYELTVKPEGMTIDPGTGVITWECAEGTHDVTVRVSNDCPSEAFQSFQIVVAPAPVAPTITTTPPAGPFTDGDAYAYDVNADGYPAPEFELTVKPTGMVINGTTGEITWTCAEGTHDVTVRAFNASGEDFQTYQIVVEPAPVAPTITTTPPAGPFTDGDAYAYDVNADGYPAPEFELTVKPTGMAINGTTGEITWTCAEGTHDVTVRAFNASGEDFQSFQIVVEPAPVAPTITTTPPAGPFTDDDAYSYDVDADGYPAPEFELTVKPSGMSINSTTGVISWTCAEGTHDVTVRAFNSAGEDFQTYQIVVNPAPYPPIITPIPDQVVMVGAYTYDVQLDDPGYPIPATFTISGPSGMTIEPITGVINWAAVKGVYNITVTATNSEGLSDDESFKLTVNDCTPYTVCWPQPIDLKALINDRVLNVYICCEDVASIDQATIRVFNIPPYAGVHEVGDSLYTTVFIMRFLGAGGMRPIPDNGYDDQPYFVYYTAGGTEKSLEGDFDLVVNVGDVTCDNAVNIDDVVFMIEYLFQGGPMVSAHGETLEELMDIDGSGRIDLLDARAIIELLH